MFMLSVSFNGHTLFVVEHQGEPWVPVLPISKAIHADVGQSIQITQKTPCFCARLLQIPLVDRVCEFLCIPIRKLFGWLTRFGSHDLGIDDALYAAWSKARPTLMQAEGRVLLTIREGQIDAAQPIPEDWLVAPLEGFHHLSSKAGYRVTSDLVHDLLYAARV